MGIGSIIGNIKERFWLFRAALEEFFQSHRKQVVRYLWVLAGIAVLCGAAIAMAIILVRPKKPSAGEELLEAFKPAVVPPEELFLADPPDFVPALIRERERRETWTAEDARPYWTDPAENPGPWRARIRSSVDELLERVP